LSKLVNKFSAWKLNNKSQKPNKALTTPVKS
jgi:hypothetical protein